MHSISNIYNLQNVYCFKKEFNRKVPTGNNIISMNNLNKVSKYSFSVK